jgi:hypothetical protein
MGMFSGLADPVDAPPVKRKGMFSGLADPLPKSAAASDPQPAAFAIAGNQQMPDSSAANPADVAEVQQALANPNLTPSERAGLQDVLRVKLNAQGYAPGQAPRANIPGPQGTVNGGLGAVNPHRNMPQGVAPGAHVPGTNDQIPGAVPTSGPGPAETWWDKAKGAMEAGATTASAIPAGIIGNVTGLAHAVGNGADAGEAKAAQTTQAIQNWVTAGPMTPAGQRYASNIAAATQDLGAVAPMNEFQALASQGAPNAARAAGDAGRAGMDALQQQFTASKALPVAARVEPTMVKPRYGVVNGKIQRVDQGAQMPAAAAEPSMAPPEVKAPTLADASPELQAAITKARAAGPTNPVAEQAHITADTLPVKITLTKGQATGDPALISAEMNTRGKAQPLVSPEFYNKQGEAVAANAEAIRAQAAPDVPSSASMIDHGQTLLDAYKQMDAPIRADISAKYKALSDANGGTLPLNGSDFVQSADQALQKANKGYFVPAEVKSLMADYREGGPMTYDAFENLRTILGAEERKYAGKDGNAAHAISLVRDSLESLPMTGEAANIKPLADAARKAAATRFAAIKSDPAYKAAVTDSAAVGEPSALADKFFGNYILKSPRANLALIREHLNGDPAAMQTIAAGTLDHLNAQLKADPTTGNFRSAQYNSALEALNPKLTALLDPKTAQQVQALAETAKRTQVQPRGSYVNNSNTLVGAMSEAAKGGLEGAANVAAHGVPVGTWTRNLLARRADAKAADNVIAPGAGVTSIREIGR